LYFTYLHSTIAINMARKIPVGRKKLKASKVGEGQGTWYVTVRQS
jgi:hypothetical protein